MTKASAEPLLLAFAHANSGLDLRKGKGFILLACQYSELQLPAHCSQAMRLKAVLHSEIMTKASAEPLLLAFAHANAGLDLRKGKGFILLPCQYSELQLHAHCSLAMRLKAILPSEKKSDASAEPLLPGHAHANAGLECYMKLNMNPIPCQKQGVKQILTSQFDTP